MKKRPEETWRLFFSSRTPRSAAKCPRGCFSGGFPRVHRVLGEIPPRLLKPTSYPEEGISARPPEKGARSPRGGLTGWQGVAGLCSSRGWALGGMWLGRRARRRRSADRRNAPRRRFSAPGRRPQMPQCTLNFKWGIKFGPAPCILSASGVVARALMYQCQLKWM